MTEAPVATFRVPPLSNTSAVIEEPSPSVVMPPPCCTRPSPLKVDPAASVLLLLFSNSSASAAICWVPAKVLTALFESVPSSISRVPDCWTMRLPL